MSRIKTSAGDSNDMVVRNTEGTVPSVVMTLINQVTEKGYTIDGHNNKFI